MRLDVDGKKERVKRGKRRAGVWEGGNVSGGGGQMGGIYKRRPGTAKITGVGRGQVGGQASRQAGGWHLGGKRRGWGEGNKASQ